jgi:transaldolase
MEDPFAALAHAGQSVWYDNINRTVLADGTLLGLISAGVVRGVTNNPTIFRKGDPRQLCVRRRHPAAGRRGAGCRSRV